MKPKQAWIEIWVKHKICGICKAHKSPSPPRVIPLKCAAVSGKRYFSWKYYSLTAQIKKYSYPEVNYGVRNYARTCNLHTEEIFIPRALPSCALPAHFVLH